MIHDGNLLGILVKRLLLCSLGLMFQSCHSYLVSMKKISVQNWVNVKKRENPSPGNSPEPLVHTYIFPCSDSWEPRHNNTPIKMSTSSTKPWFLIPLSNKRDGHWRLTKTRAELRMYVISLENLNSENKKVPHY